MSGGRKPTDLERLTQPGGKTMPDDETIPVLTERLSLPSLELDVSLPDSATAQPIEPTQPAEPAPAEERENTAFAVDGKEPVELEDSSVDETPPPTAAGASEESHAADTTVDWATVEEQAREALLRELQPRLASELDRHLRERLQPTLVRMLLATVTELRPSIEAAVRESVSRAVSAEVARQRRRS